MSSLRLHSAPSAAPLRPMRLLQRSCACGGTGAGFAALAPPVVETVLAAPGRPVDRGLRDTLELRFGRDLSQERVHTDGRTAASGTPTGSTCLCDFVDGKHGLGPRGFHLKAPFCGESFFRDRAKPDGPAQFDQVYDEKNKKALKEMGRGDEAEGTYLDSCQRQRIEAFGDAAKKAPVEEAIP